MHNELALPFIELYFSLVEENSWIFIFQEHIINTYDSAAELPQAQTKRCRH